MKILKLWRWARGHAAFFVSASPTIVAHSWFMEARSSLKTLYAFVAKLIRVARRYFITAALLLRLQSWHDASTNPIRPLLH